MLLLKGRGDIRPRLAIAQRGGSGGAWASIRSNLKGYSSVGYGDRRGCGHRSHREVEQRTSGLRLGAREVAARLQRAAKFKVDPCLRARAAGPLLVDETPVRKVEKWISIEK